MDQSEQIAEFEERVDRAVKYAIAELELTRAQLVGVLTLKAHEIMHMEARHDNEEQE